MFELFYEIYLAEQNIKKRADVNNMNRAMCHNASFQQLCLNGDSSSRENGLPLPKPSGPVSL
jgi:hypothetical protein